MAERKSEAWWGGSEKGEVGTYATFLTHKHPTHHEKINEKKQEGEGAAVEAEEKVGQHFPITN